MQRLCYNNKQKLVCYDLETEGLAHLIHRPWQLAFNISVNKKIIKEEEHYIWWDDLNIPEFLKKKIHFDQEKYERLARPPEEVFGRFAELLYDEQYIFVGHNIINFDFLMAKVTLEKLGLWKGWSFHNRILDTLLLLRMFNEGVKPEPDNLLGSQLKWVGKPARGSKKATLEAGCKQFGIDFDPILAHDSVYDTWKNAELAYALIYAHEL